MILKLNLQNSYDKVKFFILIQFLLVLIAFISEAMITRSVFYFSFIFQLTLLLFTFNFYYKALCNLFYSYWNISVILLIYYLVSMVRNLLVIESPFVTLLFFISLVLLLISSYIISSPLYYPRVNWWEYDFRFRADIRCFAEINGKQFRGRLSDLRRGAACLELFTHAQVGDGIQLHVEILNQNFNLYAEIRSKREPILGRAVVYGIKFIHADLEQEQRLKLMTNYWHESRKIKIRDKFAALKKT